MGRKRKSADYSEKHLRRKIRRLENKLRRRRQSSSSSDSSSVERDRSPAFEPDSGIYTYRNDYDNVQSDYYDDDYEPSVRSVVAAEVHGPSSPPPQRPPHVPTATRQPPPPSAPPSVQPAPQPQVDYDEIVLQTAPTSEESPAIAPDILDALGEAKTKEVQLGSKIPEEISKRWGRILTGGLNKEHKQELVTKILIPENFQLLKAPILNKEIAAVLTESSRNRDKRLEKAQNQLGTGIAGVTSIMSSLIEGIEIETTNMVKNLSEIGQILLDLHYENTVNRTKLITPILDKKFLSLIQDVKRDSYLFGENLGSTIKATKTAEKSGLQIKKSVYMMTSSKNFHAQTGPWKGPPRPQGQRAARPTASRSRGGAAFTSRRPPHASDRYHQAGPSRPPPRTNRK